MARRILRHGLLVIAMVLSAAVIPSVASEAGTLSLAIRVTMRNQAELRNLLVRLYTPHDSLFGKYLTPEQFTARFGATQGDFDRVADYFRSIGCSIRFLHPNRLLIDADCPQNQIEAALKIKISRSINAEGELVQTVNTGPSIPTNLPIEAIHGLSSAPRRAQYIRLTGPSSLGGSGPLGGLSPSDIKNAYGLSATSPDGSNQILGLFELDGFAPSDIAAYTSQFSLPAAPTRTVLVDGFNGKAGANAAEVTLDIELMMAIAPHARNIVVYEGPNTDAGVIDVYQRIADDDVATEVSTSWGLPENQSDPGLLHSENQVFEQMAAQGQSIYAASGDHGAFDDGKTLGVDDPASQPYVTGTGGTSLKTNTDHSYLSETSWWDGSVGGGGGISAVWPIPAWQNGVISTVSLGSTTHRNVPDISLDADPDSGYSIDLAGSWQVYGGTSCAAPIWAAFTALVNQSRAESGRSALGFANPAIYRIARGTALNALGGTTDLHDVSDGSTNGNFPAVLGYDLSTGWGTLNGAALLTDLSSAPSPLPSPAPSPSPSPSPVPTPSPSQPATGIASSPLINGQMVFVTHDPYQMIAIYYNVSDFPGAGGIYFEISEPNHSLLPPNGNVVDPEHLRFGSQAGVNGRFFLVPIRDLPAWGDYSIRVIPLDVTGRFAVGLFSDSSHLILSPN